MQSILRRSVIVLVALAAPAVALAVARPLRPSKGAVVSSFRPSFSWALPSNERSFAIYVSKRPANHLGRFAARDLVDAKHFQDDVRTYTARRSLYTGRYWWSVQATNTTTFKFSYSRASDFFVAETTRALGLHVSPHGASGSRIDVSWTTNSPKLLITERITRNGAFVWSAFERRRLPPIGGVRHTISTWTRPAAVAPRAVLRLEVTVAGDARSTTVSRYFRAR